ncbi:MAG: transposase [Clostridia bacterium]
MLKFITYKYRIYPNDVQKEKIENNFKCCKSIYNKLLCYRTEEYNRYKKYVKYCERNDKFVDKKYFNSKCKIPSLSKIKEFYPELKKADSLAICNEWCNLNKSFTNFFSHRGKFPKSKQYDDKKSYITCLVNNNIRINNNRLRLPKIGMIKIKLYRKIPNGLVIKRCIVMSDKIDRYYVSILVCTEIPKINKKLNIDNILGLDFKISDIFVDSNGNTPKFIRPYKSSIEKLKYLSKILSRKIKFSKNWYKHLKHIQKLHKTIAFKRKDFLDKLSNVISKKYDVIVAETLSIKEMTSKFDDGTYIYDTGYCKFLTMLKNKLNSLGKKIIKVDRWFPSSKKCSNCGSIKEDLLLEERVYYCDKCGKIQDRDENAAINIANEGKRILIENMCINQ